jgi:hypothetical protein
MRTGDNLTLANKAIIICGDPGTRKTTLALHFPAPYFFDCDNNMAAPVEQTGITNFKYDMAARDDDDKLIHPLDRFLHCAKCINAAAADPTIRTIVVDSLTTFADILLSEVRRQEFGAMAASWEAKDAADAKTMRIQDWGKFAWLLKNFFSKLRTCGKTVVVIAHNIVDKDEADARYKSFLNVPGQSKTTLSGLFTDCWTTQCEVTGIGAAAQRKFTVRTLPLSDTDHRGVKSSFKSLGYSNTFEDVVKQLKTLA